MVLKKKGMNVTTPDRKSFVDMMGPAYKKIGEIASEAEMQKLLKAIDAAK